MALNTQHNRRRNFDTIHSPNGQFFIRQCHNYSLNRRYLPDLPTRTISLYSTVNFCSFTTRTGFSSSLPAYIASSYSMQSPNYNGVSYLAPIPFRGQFLAFSLTGHYIAYCVFNITRTSHPFTHQANRRFPRKYFSIRHLSIFGQRQAHISQNCCFQKIKIFSIFDGFNQ